MHLLINAITHLLLVVLSGTGETKAKVLTANLGAGVVEPQFLISCACGVCCNRTEGGERVCLAIYTNTIFFSSATAAL